MITPCIKDGKDYGQIEESTIIVTHGYLKQTRICVKELDEFRRRKQTIHLKLRETSSIKKSNKLKNQLDYVTVIIEQKQKEVDERTAIIESWLSERKKCGDMRDEIINEICIYYLKGGISDQTNRVADYFDQKYGRVKKFEKN